LNKAIFAFLILIHFFAETVKADSEIDYPKVISEISDLIYKNYFNVEKAPDIIRKVKSLKNTEYSSVREFQISLNKILQAEDTHFGIMLNEEKYWRLLGDEPIKRDKNRHLMRVEMLEKNIGYLRLDKFLDTKEAIASYKEAINEVRGSNALIIDLRSNSGGSPRAAIRFVEMLVKLEKKNLFHITNRHYSYFMESSGKASEFMGVDVPVFLLTSKKTASAAEAVAFLLQHERNAVTIGEATVGAGNLATKYSIGQDFSLLVPTSLVKHYETEESWESKGIKPTIKTLQEDALNRAKEEASLKQ